MTLYPDPSGARQQPLVQVTEGNELVTDGRGYRTLAAWTEAVTVPGSQQAVVIEADPRANVQAVGRLVQWLRSRGTRQVVVRVRKIETGRTPERASSADSGQR